MTTQRRVRASEPATFTLRFLSEDITPSKLRDILGERVINNESGRIEFSHTKSVFASSVKKFEDPNPIRTHFKGCCLGVASVADGFPVTTLNDTGQCTFYTLEENKTVPQTDYDPTRKIYLSENHWLRTSIGSQQVIDLLMTVNDSYVGDSFEPIIHILTWLIDAGVFGPDRHGRIGFVQARDLQVTEVTAQGLDSGQD